MSGTFVSWRESIDATLSVLAHEHRRLVLQYFEDGNDHVASREELADYVKTNIADKTNAEPVLTRLHHVDLPKLDDAGVIEYDPRSGAVRFNPLSSVEELADILVRIEDN